MIISGVSRTVPARARPVRGGIAGSGFRVGEAQAEASEGAAGAAPVTMSSLLALQEAESSAVQDREARRHGTAVLDELSELQRALLGEDGPDLNRLASLAGRPVAAADPGLAGVLKAIQLRAGIELARRRPAASR